MLSSSGRLLSDLVEPPLRLAVDVCGERAARRGANVLLQMLGIQRTDDRGVDSRVSEQKAEQEGRAALALLPQLVQLRCFELLPALLAAAARARLPARDPTPDDRPRPRRCGAADHLLVGPLQPRVRDLIGVEPSPLDI